MSAREMTAEIDRMTGNGDAPGAVDGNLALQPNNQASRRENANVAQHDPRMAREQAQRVGWQVMEGGRGQAEALRTPEFDPMQAERELRRVEDELERPDDFVGQTSELQNQAYLANDAEDLRDEMGEGLKFVDRIVARNQEEVAAKIAPEIDKLARQGSFRPSEVVSMYNRGTAKMLGVFNRQIGDRNNAA